MRWERRKPLWPVAVALGSLFALALAAPSSWQSVTSRQTRRPAQPLKRSPVIASPHAVSPLETNSPQPVSDERTETLPTRKEVNFDALIKIRNGLRSLLDRIPAAKQAARSAPLATIAQPQKNSPQVRVTSEFDRLALVPPRQRASNRGATPDLPMVSPADDASNFAAILLESARRPQPVDSTPTVGRRLAMRPSSPSAAEITLPSDAVSIDPSPTVIPTIQQPTLRHKPLALIKQLESFAPGSPGAVWSQRVLTLIRQLTEERHEGQTSTVETLDQLERLHAEGAHQFEATADAALRNRWQNCAQSLERRLALWRLLLNPEQPRVVGNSSGATSLLPVLNAAAEILNDERNGNAWREYLLLDQIAAATSEGIDAPALTRAKLAQQVLSRMADRRLTDAQRDFLRTIPLVQLHQALRPWAAGKVNLETLAAIVERYESGREMRYAAAIAQLQQRLKWSEDPQLQELAAHLEEDYRAANMRLAMSGDLLNRMLPKQEPIVTPVRDRIAGTKVRGRARTTTQLRIRLLPNPDAWHVSLDAFGKVYSDTRSQTWPARIRNAAKLQYRASKEIALDEQGLHVSPAQATARGRNELLEVDSQLDLIPLVGLLLRDIARKKHKKSRPVALTQAKAKVVRQVKKRMDATLEQKLEALEQKFRDKVLAPIEQLALVAEPLDMHTTDHRAVMELRLANIGQLAAHTLRPLAPSDSVLSLQMHESALNNAMTGLGLDGRRMTMLELFDFISQQFGQAEASPPVEMPRRAVIDFASSDAVRVQCEGDRLELVFSIAELSYRQDKIKNFEIHVHFRPLISGLSVKLVRDGTLQFSGRRLKTGPRVVLHSVIGKLLEKDQEIDLLSAKVLDDPRLAGLMVTQLVLEDGWIGMALGPARPNRTAWRAHTPILLPTPFVR